MAISIKRPTLNANDPRWMQQLKTWCEDVARAIDILNRLRGDSEYIYIDDMCIKFLPFFSGVAYVAGVKITGLNSDASKPWIMIDFSAVTATEVTTAEVMFPFPPNIEFYEKSKTFGDIHVLRA